MIILASVLIFIGIILLLADRNNINSKLGSGMAFCGASGGLAVVIEEDMITFLQNYTLFTDSVKNSMYILADILSMIAHHPGPYVFILFGVYYSNVLNDKNRKLLVFILLIPMLLSFFVYPLKTLDVQRYYIVMSFWASPYILGCAFLVFYAYLKESEKETKKIKLFNAIFLVPLLICVSFTNFILRGLEFQDTWRLNTIVVAMQFIIFIFIASKYGILGIKLKFEKHNINNTIKAMSSGASIINHALKNEVVTILMCIDNIKYNNDAESIKIAESTTQHMMKIVDRIQEQLGEIKIYKKYADINEVIINAIDIVSPWIKKKNIEIDYKEVNKYFSYDCVHIKEVLINLLKNSMEAIVNEGYIKIRVLEIKKSISIQIIDNGKGISKLNVHKVIEPFFTTKKMNNNFGLGLTYCYNVINNHDGSLQIESEEFKYTKVSLKFDKSRC